jgi:peptide chain release factor 1
LHLEIYAGEGGGDSRAFVYDLLGVYVRYGESCGLKAELQATEPGYASIRFSGARAAWHFRHEPGKHVVQRVPAGDKRHTSVVSVAILPLPPSNQVPPLKLDEVDITAQCGHGPGGQHQNKTASAIRAIHRPTGLSVFINGRDQHSNKREALRVLAARVGDSIRKTEKSAYDGLRRQQHGGGSRGGDKVRTYNFCEGRVVDHRLGSKTRNIKEVMKGRLGLLFGL